MKLSNETIYAVLEFINEIEVALFCWGERMPGYNKC